MIFMIVQIKESVFMIIEQLLSRPVEKRTPENKPPHSKRLRSRDQKQAKPKLKGRDIFFKKKMMRKPEEEQEQVLIERRVTHEMNSSTFLRMSDHRKKYTKFARKIFNVPDIQIQRAVKALKHYHSIHKKEARQICIEIEFVHELKGNPRPFHIRTNCRSYRRGLILVRSCQNFLAKYEGQLPSYFQIMQIGEAKQANLKDRLIFCDFNLYRDCLRIAEISKFKPFPIDTNEIPQALRHEFKSYGEFLDSLSLHSYVQFKQTKVIHCRLGDLTDSVSSLRQGVRRCVEGVIGMAMDHDKNKHNQVSKVIVWSGDSERFVLFEPQ